VFAREGLEPRQAAVGQDDAVALVFERFAGQDAVRLVVVDDQDGRNGRG
jgi:hypothetical protein